MSSFLYAILCLAVTLSVYSSSVPSPSSLQSSIRILRQNDLNFTDANNHASVLLLEPASFTQAAEKCALLHESLVDINVTPKFSDDLKSLISYLEFRGDFPPSQAFWIGNKNPKQPATVKLENGRLIQETHTLPLLSAFSRLPALCSQQAPFRPASQSDKNPNFQVSVSSGKTTYTGFRDQLSFRFLGIPFANPPKRWEHSTVMNTESETHVDATNFGSQCWQTGSGPFSENCLFLNVLTPILPESSTKSSALKPVLFWIHGGAFTGGTGADSTFEGGAMVSRGDVVLVTTNYRLTTLGFLSLGDGIITGNYGLNDQITALKWVKQHIRAFGGDPSRVTVFGQSAGASSVRALLSSPLAKGTFSAVIMMSNLMGDGFSEQFSIYPTPQEELQLAGNAIVMEAGCANSTNVVACLKALPPQNIIALSAAARFLVVDGLVLPKNQLSLNHTGFAINVPTMMGTMMEDGGAFIGFPTVGESLQAALTPIVGFPSAVLVANRSDLFPVPTGPNTTLNFYNVTARAATDVMFKCLDQATAVAAAKNHILSEVFYYTFARSYQTPGFDPNFPVCDPPKTAAHPFGDPSQPYFRCHSGELFYVFSTLDQFGLPYRDSGDLPMTQITMDYWLSFAWNHNPNPPKELLIARGYTTTLAAVEETSVWEPVNAKQPTLRVLDFPVRKESQISFQDLAQCELFGSAFALNALE